MDAIVEVETAGMTVKGITVTVVAVEKAVLNLITQTVVSASAVAPSIGGCSISAVAPDYSNGKELALAGV